MLAGGESSERDVSLNSARAITSSLVKSGHRVRVIDSLNGRGLLDHSGQFITDEKSPHDSSDADQRALAVSLPSTNELIEAKKDGVDVVFLGLHGGMGENGTIQAMLEIMGIPYTGSPMAASAIAMDKDITKRVMTSLGIPTAAWERYDAIVGRAPEETAQLIEHGRIPLPFVVKPTDGGSTVGLTLVESREDTTKAVAAAFAVARSLIVERYLAGREITIAVLDGKPLPPVEIKPTHKLYDYTCKYTKGKSQYICPADIDENIVRQLAADAVALYHTINCRGYARIDFIVGHDGTYICLELNTLPGMTELSLFPMAARAAGIEFDQLLEKLCYLALEKK